MKYPLDDERRAPQGRIARAFGHMAIAELRCHLGPAFAPAIPGHVLVKDILPTLDNASVGALDDYARSLEP